MGQNWLQLAFSLISTAGSQEKAGGKNKDILYIVGESSRRCHILWFGILRNNSLAN